MEHHRSSLLKGPVLAEQCRVKMGLILSGVGDKVMRLWSLDSYNCVGEYAIPNGASLYDFDFDESKIVGLVGTKICIWRRNGRRNLFPERESTFNKGLCMRYFDPLAVVGCEDGTARVFDMYSKRCSQIIRMHSEAVTRICFSEDQLVLCGSSLGRITVSSLSSDHRVATLRATDYKGIKALCFNPSSRLVFAGTTAGCTSCWDLRTMRRLWERRVSPNVVYAMQHLHHDVSTLLVGGLDGILRVQDQNTGEVLSSYVLDYNTSCVDRGRVMIERVSGRKLSKYEDIDKIHRRYRPPITSLAVGMKKVITTHNSKFIRVWKFE
ncbi:hypothetical protein K2173_014344 [Erythroxylum novogranatense]|uniref:F-box/WD-40 repeat-containing protein At3g52030 n=1 Tax=Erythroxylum novogranatense TaxID=1862640 RepID=A0AAV8T242_9ROSI|nr:hypothetical protein K2173_014344 [Erythroxylum novogranatense]